jgi:hypothetical protein
MLRLHSPDRLDEWLTTCIASQFSDLREFALGLLRDLMWFAMPCRILGVMALWKGTSLVSS